MNGFGSIIIAATARIPAIRAVSRSANGMGDVVRDFLGASGRVGEERLRSIIRCTWATEDILCVFDGIVCMSGGTDHDVKNFLQFFLCIDSYSVFTMHAYFRNN
jgi:hypothetical protein